MSTHVYSHEACGPNDPVATQPPEVTVVMKPHQLTTLAKMIQMETTLTVQYPNATLQDCTIGILADKPSSGKTLSALSIVASDHAISSPETTLRAYKTPEYGQTFRIVEERPEDVIDYLDTTLIIVPHGPVFAQWAAAIRDQTSMKCLQVATSDALAVIARQHLDTRGFIASHKVVLVSSQMIMRLRDMYSYETLRYWKRVIIDEAHSISFKRRMTDLHAKFVWFVTATPHKLHTAESTGYIRSSFRHHSFYVERTLDYLCVRNEDTYIEQSFGLPEPIHTEYICRELFVSAGMVTGLVSSALVDMLNANDIDAATEALRGRSGDDIVDLIARDVKATIHNLELELDFVQRQTLPEITRRLRIERLNRDLESARARHDSIIERITRLDDTECPICYDAYVSPVSLGCSHVFCAACIERWIRTKEQEQAQQRMYRPRPPFCPVCKDEIKADDLFCLDGRLASSQGVNRTGQDTTSQTPTKDEQILKLIQDRPDGLFIVFCNYEASFRRLERSLLEIGVRSCVLKGNTATQNKVLRDFREGNTRVIMLNTRFSGSGIDIHYATDVILYQRFDPGTTEQVIGRAQRVGRTDPLHVHHLYHYNEYRTHVNGTRIAAQPAPPIPFPEPSTSTAVTDLLSQEASTLTSAFMAATIYEVSAGASSSTA